MLSLHKNNNKSPLLLLCGVLAAATSSSTFASAATLRSSSAAAARELQTSGSTAPTVTPLPPPETKCYQNVMLGGQLQLQLLDPCPTAGSCVSPSGCASTEGEAFVDGEDVRCKSDTFLVLQHIAGYAACEWQYICCTYAAPSPAPTPL
jgi:hypothetical protein